MQNLSQEYIELFNAITEAEKALSSITSKLLIAQRVAEEIYINGGDGNKLS